MIWLVDKVGAAAEDSTFPEIAESCGFSLMAHKDQTRCRLSAGPRWDVPGHRAGTTLAEAEGADVPADVVANAVELAQVLLARVRERQAQARLPGPLLRSGGIYAPEDFGGVAVATSLKGVFDVDVVAESTGRGVFVGFLKPRSQDVVPNAIREALARHGRRMVS